jgi:cytochrome b561
MCKNQLKKDSGRYATVTRCIHWLFAAAFVISLLSGLIMTSLSSNEYLSYLLPKYHYLSGVFLIALTAWRVISQFFQTRPAYPEDVKPFDIKIAKFIQWSMLLLGLLVMCSGYVLATADGNPALLPWGTWLVQIVPSDSFDIETALRVHNISLIAFCSCLGPHVLGFIKHQIKDKQFYKRIV